MSRQIGQRFQEPSVAALEERVRWLENQVSILTDAVRALARGLEDHPMAELGEDVAARAGRQAHELLLIATSAPHPHPDRK